MYKKLFSPKSTTLESIIDDSVILPIEERYKKFKIVGTPNISKNKNYVMTLKNKDGSVFVVKDGKRICPNYSNIEHLEFGKDKENFNEVLILARNQDETFIVNLNGVERFTGHGKIRKPSVKYSIGNDRLYFIYSKFKDPNLHYPSSNFAIDNFDIIEYDNGIEKNIKETYEEDISPHISKNGSYILKIISPVNLAGDNIFYINNIRIQLNEEFLNIPDIGIGPIVIKTKKDNPIDDNGSVYFDLTIRRGGKTKGELILNKGGFLKFINNETGEMLIKKHYSDKNWIEVIKNDNGMIDFEGKTFPQSAFDRYLHKKALE